jgi:hypothetical protein
MDERRRYWIGRWAKALRSGRYLQIRGPWRNAEGFCACGVLKDLMILDGLRQYWDGDRERDSGALSAGPLKAGSPSELALVGADAFFGALDRNESQDNTFPEIADWLESLLPAETTEARS